MTRPYILVAGEEKVTEFISSILRHICISLTPSTLRPEGHTWHAWSLFLRHREGLPLVVVAPSLETVQLWGEFITRVRSGNYSRPIVGVSDPALCGRLLGLGCTTWVDQGNITPLVYNRLHAQLPSRAAI